MTGLDWQPLNAIFQNTSCHAGNWLQHTKNPILKGTLIGILVLFHGFILNYFITSLLQESHETFTTIDWITEPFLIGPKVTVCNPRMFDKARVDQLNISSELLSYIFSAYDYVDQGYVPRFQPFASQLEREYQQITKNVSNIGHFLAIR